MFFRSSIRPRFSLLLTEVHSEDEDGRKRGRSYSRSSSGDRSNIRERSLDPVSPVSKRVRSHSVARSVSMARSQSPEQEVRHVVVQSPPREKDGDEKEDGEDVEKSQIDPELQELLWKRQTEEKVFAPPVFSELEVRLNEVGRLGLPAADLRELLTRYPVIENCKTFVTPKLNAEIAETLPEREKARDLRIAFKQEKTAALLTAISVPLGSLFRQNRAEDKLAIAALLDAAKLAAEIFHEENEIRRSLATSHLDKPRRKVLMSVPSDELLFGSNLGDALKAAKAVSQSVAELRIPHAAPKNLKRPPPRPSQFRQVPRGGQKPRSHQQPSVRRPPAPRPSYRPIVQNPQPKRKRSVSRKR